MHVRSRALISSVENTAIDFLDLIVVLYIIIINILADKHIYYLWRHNDESFLFWKLIFIVWPK